MEIFEEMTFNLVELQEFIDEYNSVIGCIFEIKIRPNEKMLVRVEGKLKEKLLAHDDLQGYYEDGKIAKVFLEKDNTIFYTSFSKET